MLYHFHDVFLLVLSCDGVQKWGANGPKLSVFSVKLIRPSWLSGSFNLNSWRHPFWAVPYVHIISYHVRSIKKDGIWPSSPSPTTPPRSLGASSVPPPQQGAPPRLSRSTPPSSLPARRRPSPVVPLPAPGHRRSGGFVHQRRGGGRGSWMVLISVNSRTLWWTPRGN